MPRVMSARMAARRLRLIGEDYAYAAYWNARGLVDPKTPEDYLTGTRMPVVAIPGIYEGWRFLTPIIDAMHEAGHPVVVFPELRHNMRPVIDTAKTVAHRLVDGDFRDAVIFAHSKGGLIGKYVMQRLDPQGRIDRMIAVCSPFSGTRRARYAPIPQLRVFSPESPVTTGLSGYREINARITSIYSRYDPHIPEGSELEGARNIRLPIDGHFQILGDPLLRDLVLRELREA